MIFIIFILVIIGGLAILALMGYVASLYEVQNAQPSPEDHYSRLKSPASSTLSYQNQSTSRSVQLVPSSDHKQPDTKSIEWACQVLGLSIDELTQEKIQQAYEQKMEEYQANNHQNLPESIKQLLEQKIQEVNKAKDILIP